MPQLDRSSVAALALTAISIFLIVSTVAHGQSARPQPLRPAGDVALLERIQILDQELQQQLRVVHLASTDGLDLDEWQPQIEALDRRLETLRRDLDAAEPNEVVLRKAQALELLMGNLRLALDLGSGEGALPLAAVEAPVVAARSFFRVKAAPSNDDCGNAIDISLGNHAGSTTESTNDGQSSCGGAFFAPDVWYRYTATEDRVVFVDTIGSSYDTVLSIHTECPGVIGNELDCDDDGFGLQSVTSFDAVAGEDYFIRVSGFDGAVGEIVLNVNHAGSIEGSVFDSTTGDPIPEYALVTVYDVSGYYVRQVYVSNEEYGVGGLQTGSYYAHARPYDWTLHTAELFDDVACVETPPWGCDFADGTPIPVTLNAVTPGIDFALDPAGVITGYVRNSGTGDPIQSARVRIHDENGEYVRYDDADSSGYFEVYGLAAGTYHAVAAHSWYRDELFNDLPCEGGSPAGCDATEGAAIAVGVGETVLGIDFDLDPSGSVEGTVTNVAYGLPILDVRVNVYDQDGDWRAAAYTETDGSYRVGGLPDGTVFIAVSDYRVVDELYDDIPCSSGCDKTAGTPVAVTIGTVTGGIDFALQEIGRISGSVTQEATGLPRPNLRVEIYRSTGVYQGSAYTAADGSWGPYHLSDGTYYVLTDSYSCLDELYDDIGCDGGFECIVFQGDPVSVMLGTETGSVDFVLDCFGRVSGEVTDEGTGAPLGGIRVELWTGSGVRDSDYSDSLGIYSLEADPGTYYVATDDRGLYVDELFDDLPCFRGPTIGCDPYTGTPIDLDVNTELAADLQLSPGSTMSGQVTDAASGDPLYSSVYLYDAAGRRLEDYHASSGMFQFEGLPAGTYFAKAARSSSHLSVLYDGVICLAECNPTAGTPIAVGEAVAVEGIDFALPRLSTITGHVRSSGIGRPLGEIRVVLYDSSGKWEDSDDTDSSGAYEFYGVQPGTYHVLTDSRTIVDELFDGLPCEGGCDPTAGTPIETEAGLDIAGIDFSVDVQGEITGVVIDEATGNPVQGVWVRVFNVSGQSVESVYSGSNGIYTARGLEPGDYFLTATFSSYGGMLYDGIPCHWDCDPTTGTPVAVELNQTTSGVDFAMPNLGRIEGVVRDAMTGGSVSATVEIWSGETGAYEKSVYSYDGSYSVDLPPGTYYLATDLPSSSSPYLGELYNDIACYGGPMAGCDPMKGSPVVVTSGATVSGIDFELSYIENAITGTVTDESSGTPLGGVRVDIWRADNQDLVSSTVTLASGVYRATPAAGDYLVSTENGQGYVNEIYDDVACPAGSSLVGLCDPALGTPVTVIPNSVTTGVDFALTASESMELFGDDFEDGNDNAWSDVVGDGCKVAGQAAHTGDYGLQISAEGSCPHDDSVDLGAQVITGPLTVDACTTITAGDGFVLAGGGVASLTAGLTVAFGNGFTVESGAGLAVAIESMLVSLSHLTDSTPAAESRYYAEFFFNIDDLLPSGSSWEMTLLELRSASGQPHLRVVLLRNQVRLDVRDDAGVWHTASRTVTMSGWNRVVLAWYASVDGTVWMSVNHGGSVEVSPVDTSSLDVGSVRWGIVATEGGSFSGSISFDDFMSWR